MRVTAILMTVALLAAAPAAAQTSIPEEHPYGLDPYKPSDAAILRTWGSTLVAQTPLLELRIWIRTSRATPLCSVSSATACRSGAISPGIPGRRCPRR